MIPEEKRLVVRARERAHAVVEIGDTESVIHRLADARQDAVLEALGQVEDTLGVGDERPESARPPSCRRVGEGHGRFVVREERAQPDEA